MAGCGVSSPEFGFQAYYEIPCKETGRCCGLDGCGPESSPWMDGPHARFDEPEAKWLTLESIEWFEESWEADDWRENPTARLELIYPSNTLRVTARYALELELSWEEQLRSWFERFPPGGEALTYSDAENYFWVIDFDDRGSVRGRASSEKAALEEMKSRISSEEAHPVFRQPAFSLTHLVRRSSHVMDCYSVEVNAADQIDDLPLRLREKMAKYARN